MPIQSHAASVQGDKTIGQKIVTYIHSLYFLLQAMKMETGLICLVMIILFISLMPLCTISIWACSNERDDDYAERTLNGDDERQIDSIVAFEETIDRTMHCRRVFQFLLQFFSVILMWVSWRDRDEHLLLLFAKKNRLIKTLNAVRVRAFTQNCSKFHKHLFSSTFSGLRLYSASITVMFITNELMVSGVAKTSNLVKSSLKDVELFSRDAHNQIVNAVHDGIDTSIERIRYDLQS